MIIPFQTQLNFKKKKRKDATALFAAWPEDTQKMFVVLTTVKEFLNDFSNSHSAGQHLSL